MRLLTDLDPRHLSTAAILALIAGLVAFFTSGFFVIWNGGWLAWTGLALGLLLIVAGAWSMAREKQDEAGADETNEAGA